MTIPRVFFGGVLTALMLVVSVLGVQARSTDNVSGYAWSENVGWIHTNGGIYGVNIKSNGLVDGYAWSDAVGWVSFTKKDLKKCPSGACEARFNAATGALSGWAKALAGDEFSGANEDGWDGWIKLAGTAQNGASYGAKIEDCKWNGWAWGSDVVGWIHLQGSVYGVTGSGSDCGKANLAPIGLTPTQVTVGVEATFIATLKNTGRVPTPEFASSIYVCLASDDPCQDTSVTTKSVIQRMAALIRSVYAASPVRIALNGSPIDAGQEGTQTGNHTFTIEGDYMMRLCADLPANTVDEGEAGELDNCGDWTLLVVGPATSPTFSVAPASASIAIGGTQEFEGWFDGDGSGPLAPTKVTASAAWSSSVSAIATISTAGGRAIATGVAKGNVVISAQYISGSNTYAGSATLEVTDVTGPGGATGEITVAKTKNGSYASAVTILEGGDVWAKWSTSGNPKSCTVTSNIGISGATLSSVPVRSQAINVLGGHDITLTCDSKVLSVASVTVEPKGKCFAVSPVNLPSRVNFTIPMIMRRLIELNVTKGSGAGDTVGVTVIGNADIRSEVSTIASGNTKLPLIVNKTATPKTGDIQLRFTKAGCPARTITIPYSIQILDGPIEI